jgi:hypothetical protein
VCEVEDCRLEGETPPSDDVMLEVSLVACAVFYSRSELMVVPAGMDLGSTTPLTSRKL